jgi:hypothetical protein
VAVEILAESIMSMLGRCHNVYNSQGLFVMYSLKFGSI